MSSNTFGNILTLTSWGESHGESIGGVLDGVPSNILLNEKDIQSYLDKRKPNSTFGTSSRNEKDKIILLSGIFEGKTTGAPIAFMIKNEDHKSSDYSNIKNLFRPGHADFTYFNKYKNVDYRGGGRSSARETAIRVAAGAIAKKIIPHIDIKGALIQIGNLKINEANWNDSEIIKNSFFCPDSNIVPQWENLINQIKNDGDSIGAMIQINIKNVDIGLGEPVYNKLSAELAKAIMSINAVKSFEIGEGINVANMRGSENCDQIIMKNEKPKFLSNHAGGILGGISTGQDIIIKFAVKPTSSICIKQKTITKDLKNTTIETIGRHDTCIGIRAVPVGEAMVSLVLADFYLINKIYKDNTK